MSSTKYWLAILNIHGTPVLQDGPHDTPDGAEEAITLISRLGFDRGENREYAIAKVELSEPTGKHSPVNDEAIGVLNDAGICP